MQQMHSVTHVMYLSSVTETVQLVKFRMLVTNYRKTKCRSCYAICWCCNRTSRSTGMEQPQNCSSQYRYAVCLFRTKTKLCCGYAFMTVYLQIWLYIMKNDGPSWRRRPRCTLSTILKDDMKKIGTKLNCESDLAKLRVTASCRQKWRNLVGIICSDS